MQHSNILCVCIFIWGVCVCVCFCNLGGAICSVLAAWGRRVVCLLLSLQHHPIAAAAQHIDLVSSGCW